MYHNKKLLIVDDSPVERKILKDALFGLGFIILEAENGEAGVAMANEHIPDIILMDVIMPGINGHQATKQITTNEKLKKIIVIMCTSKGEEIDKKWGERQGAKGYVVKPVDKLVLLEQIQKLFY
jgi:twitching motility two-component system response regulator PilH